MDKATVINLLTNSGIKVFGMDDNFIFFEDPGCIFPAFDTIFHYAWLAILIFTAILLFAWGVFYIRKGLDFKSLVNNTKSLLLILLIFSSVKPIVDFIYGDNLFTNMCEMKQVSISKVQELLDLRNKKFGKSDKFLLNESFQIIDSGPQDFDTDTQEQ
ncbi:MAG: hypothetical protein IKZ49_03435 [Alphaproteobacteria bacterium]|nr:hypothetical protein [Alphaproteobacteria bacterium]